MSERKIDLLGDLVLPTRKGVSVENDEDKALMGFLDEVKDQAASESSIPLSPQWLYVKPSDAKLDIRGLNSLSLGSSTDSVQKESDKKDWRKLVSETESARRWREEERETGLLGRRDRKKTERRVENVSVREAADVRIMPSSERWNDTTNRNSAHDSKRDGKWSSRWGPEDKDKESRPEKKMEVEKEVAHSDGHSTTIGNRDAEPRDKWRPRHRAEPNTSAPSAYRAAPGFGPDKGKADSSAMGFTVGRGRSSNVPLMKAPLGSLVGIIQVSKNDNILGKSSVSVEAFHYPRAKLLDIYRFQKLDPSLSVKLDSMEEVPSLTQVEIVEPLAFVAPDTEEEAILKDIWKGGITGSEASYNPSRQGKVSEAAVGNVDSLDGKSGLLPGSIIEEAIVSSKGSANVGMPQTEGKNTTCADDLKRPCLDSEGLMPTVLNNADVIRADGDNCSVFGIRHNVLDEFERAASDIGSKLPDDSSSLFVSHTFGESQDNKLPVTQAERDGTLLGDGIPFEELSLFYCDPQGEIQGPFLGVDIMSWFEQGFFNTDLPVRLADAPENASFQELGDIMPHLEVQDGTPFGSDLNMKLDNHIGSASTPEINNMSTLNNQRWRPSDLGDNSNQPAYSNMLLEHDGSSRFAFSGRKGFLDSSVQDEEIVFPGKPGSGGNLPPRVLRSADGRLSNPVGHLSRQNEFQEIGMSMYSEDKLHPFGLLYSELQDSDTKHNQPPDTSVSVSAPGQPVGQSMGRVSPFGGVPETNVVDNWGKIYNKGSIASSNMFGDSLENQHFSHYEQEHNHRELAEQLMSRQLQQQQIQQRNILSQLSHFNDSPLEQVPVRNSIQHHLANQPLSELEHFLALQQQEQELQRQRHLQHLHEQQLQEQQSQTRQQLLEQFLCGPVRDPRFSQSHIDPSGGNSILDQMLHKQQFLHDSQARSHQPSRHNDPYIEQLIQAKLDQAMHQEHQAELLELMQHSRHDQFSTPPMLQQEQLQARLMSMGLRQRPEHGEGRSVGSGWPVDESDQALRSSVGSQRASSSAFNHLEMFQQQEQQRQSREEELREFERHLQMQERLKRGLYDPGALPFEQPMSLPGGGPGMNLDMMNAMTRLQGLDIQDPHSHIRPAGQPGSFTSASRSHQHHHFVPNEFNISQFDAEGRWPESDSRMPNDWVESHIQRLHLNAEQQKREHLLDENNSKRMLMELLHQKSNLQSTQPRNSNECLNNQAAIPSFASIAGEPTQFQLREEHADDFDSIRRLPGRTRPGIVMEGESIYAGVAQSSASMYANAGIDREYPDMGGRRQIPNLINITKGSISEISEIMSKQPVLVSPDGRENPISSISRQSSTVIGTQASSLNDKIGRSSSFTEDIACERTPTVLSRGSENVLLKRPPISRHFSSQEGLSDLGVDPTNKTMNAALGGRREMGGSGVDNKRRTNSCDGDVLETSFVDLLKSNGKKAETEIGDGNQKSGKKKGKKGRQIDPALLGFKVTSNRIMMGEIQRIDD